MTKLTEQKWDDHHKHVFFCDANDGDYVSIEWDDEDDEWRYLEVVDWYYRDSLKDRIKAAFQILLGRPLLRGSVLLDQKNAKAMRDALVELVDGPEDSKMIKPPISYGGPHPDGSNMW